LGEDWVIRSGLKKLEGRRKEEPQAEIIASSCSFTTKGVHGV
jgi:hypothetical protein